MNDRQTRYECLVLAKSFVETSYKQADDIIPLAEKFLQFVTGNETHLTYKKEGEE